MKPSAIALVFAPALVSGCIPYPVYKTLQPAAEMTVQDADGNPLGGAVVTLIASAYPNGLERSRETRTTAADGIAAFQAHRAWRTEVMVLHGWEEYFWNWCVQKEGFQTLSSAQGNAPAFAPRSLVRLQAGPSEPCPRRIP